MKSSDDGDMQPLEQEEENLQALLPVRVSEINFHGDPLDVALIERNGEFQVVVPLRQFCDYLGVDWSAQRQRLVRDEVLAAEIIQIVFTDENLPRQRGYYNRPVTCLPLEIFSGWLFNISPTRVKPELREKVQQYRRLCYRALYDAFRRGELFPVEDRNVVDALAIQGETSEDTRINALSEQIETMEAVVSLMQEHKAALLAEAGGLAAVVSSQQELLARSESISSQLDYVVLLLERLVGRQETTENRVARIDERTAHLTPSHAKYVRDMVDRIVQATSRQVSHTTLNYAQVYARVYGRFKRSFQVAKYDQIADERFEDVKLWLEDDLRRVQVNSLPEQSNLF